MNWLNYSSFCLRISLFSILALVFSCADHDMPEGNLPESKCKAVDGSDRLYPCEFLIEKITFLDKDGADLASVTGDAQSLSVSRFRAQTNTYDGSVEGQYGAATFEVRITLKRIARPSFPVNLGYLIGYTHNSAGRRILHTPSFAGDTYGERTKLGDPMTLSMAIGESQDVIVKMVYPYKMENIGGAVRPISPSSLTSFFVDNDVTTLKFNRSMPPYGQVGSVVEAYIEKIMVAVTN